MAKTDRDYFCTRAEMELDLAQRAVHPAAVHAHYMLAGYYLNLLYPEPFSRDRQVEPRSAALLRRG